MEVKSARKTLINAVMSLSLLISVASLQAATQGRSGETSSGQFTIRLVIPSNLETQQLASTQETSAGVATVARFNQREPVCIKGKGIDNYRLTAEGSGNDGAFVVNSANRSHRYDVQLWTSMDNSQSLFSGRPSPAIASMPPYQDCQASDTRLSVQMDPSLARGAAMSGILNLTVSAE